MIEERIYLGRDNEAALQLLSDGAPIDGAQVSRALLRLTRGAATIEVDSDATPGAFDWSRGLGILELKLGGVGAITAGRYSARLVIFDVSHLNGLVWGEAFVIIAGQV